jgi:hypothetical protein
MRGGGAGSVIGPNESRAGAGDANEAPEGDTTEGGHFCGLADAAGGGVDPGTGVTGAGEPSGATGSPSMGAGAGNVVEPEGAGNVFVALGAGGGDEGTGVTGSSR